MQLTDKQKSEGWRIVKFGEIAKSVSKRVNPTIEDSEKYIGLEHLESGKLDISVWGSEVPLKGQKLQMKKGDILFGKRNAYLKRVSIAPIDGIFSAHGMILNACGKLILEDYLPYLMQSNMFMERAIAISEGSLSPTIKWKTLARQSFPLPPIPLQKEYLKLLNAGRTSLQAVDKALIDLISLKRIMISKSFANTINDEDKSNLVKFSTVTEVVSGQVDPKVSPYKSLPHIAPDNMEQKTGRLLGYNTAEQDGVTSGKYHFDESWILYSKIRPNLRKICWPKIEGICSADVYPLRGKNGLLTEYLFYLMQSEHFNQYAVSVSMRSGFPKINRDDLGAYKLVVPDEEYQANIVKSLKEVDLQYEQLLKHKKSLIFTNQKALDEIVSKGTA